MKVSFMERLANRAIAAIDRLLPVEPAVVPDPLEPTPAVLQPDPEAQVDNEPVPLDPEKGLPDEVLTERAAGILDEGICPSCERTVGTMDDALLHATGECEVVEDEKTEGEADPLETEAERITDQRWLTSATDLKVLSLEVGGSDNLLPAALHDAQEDQEPSVDTNLLGPEIEALVQRLTTEPDRKPWKDSYLALYAGISRILADPNLDARAELAKLIGSTPSSRTNRRRSQPKSCRVPGCSDPYRAKGFCGAHYQQWTRGRLNLDGTVPSGSGESSS